MFGIGMPELIIILVVALIVLGPDKLPDMARSLGKGLSALKNAADDVKKDVIESVEEPKKEISRSSAPPQPAEPWLTPVDSRQTQEESNKVEEKKV